LKIFGATTPLALFILCAGVLSALAQGPVPSVPTNHQIMFAGNGSGTFSSQPVPFKFSAQCYGSYCVGALAFGPINAAKYVNYVTGTVVQLPQPDSYMMSLSTPQPPPGTSPPNTNIPRISCSLANHPPITQGQTNTVTVSCSAPAGTGVSNHAMVVAPSSTNN
jgi:hypothetical protein